MVDLVPWWLEQTDDINPHQLLIEAAGEAALWPKGTAGQSAYPVDGTSESKNDCVSLKSAVCLLIHTGAQFCMTL